MIATILIDSKPLISEITRYLAAIELFRAERCEPTLLSESARAGRSTNRYS